MADSRVRIQRSRNLQRRLGLIAIFRRITLLLLLELYPIHSIRSSFLMRGPRKSMRWLRR